MKLRFLFILSTFALVANMVAQSSDGLIKGIKMIDEAQYRSAITCLMQMPQSLETEYQLGKVYLILEKNDSAELHLNNVVRINPKSVYATIALGVIELQKKNTILASTLLKKATKQAKKDVVALSEVAKICVLGLQKDFNQAIETIEFGKSIHSQSVPLAIANGDVEMMRNEYGKALSAYEWAVSYDSKNAQAFRKMGVIQSIAHDYKNAYASLTKSLELDPEQILGYKNLSDLLFLYGKYDQSLSFYQTYLNKTVPNIEDKERYSLILFFNKKYDEAAKEMDVVLRENPNSAVLYRIRGYIAFETGDYQKGIELMTKFFEIQIPSKILTSDYAYLGKLYSKTNNNTEAISYLKKAISADSAQNDIIEVLANVYSSSHQHQNAVSCYNMMITNGMPRANGLFQIGKQYYFMGSYLKAASDSLNKGNVTAPLSESVKQAFQMADSVFSKLITLSPNFGVGYVWKGRALSTLEAGSNSGLAKDTYEKAISILESGDLVSNKKSLIECYNYLASFYYTSYVNNYKANVALAKESKTKSISYFEKILQLDPNNIDIKKTITDLKK